MQRISSRQNPIVLAYRELAREVIERLAARGAFASARPERPSARLLEPQAPIGTEP